MSIVQWVTYRNIFLLIYHCRSIKGWYHEKTFYKIILQLLYHTHCVMLKFFQLDFNSPAVNTFFTATKIFSHSRFINGWYIGKLFCDFILSISLYHHLGKRKKIFTRQFYNSRSTPIVCNEKIFLIFLAYIANISLSCVHHLNTREIFLYKILSTPRVHHLNSSKKSQQKNNPKRVELFSM